jgi:DnaJ-domain-containing protein 1
MRLLLFAFLLLLGVVIIRRTMLALRGARLDNGRSADGETQRSQGQNGSGQWWEVLGVSQNACLEEINQHYRQAIRMNHPDKVSEMAPEIHRACRTRTKELNAAYSEAKRVHGGAAK